ncbi:MAG: transglutaminase family protein [Pseudonocardiales bacterium]|nr:transglutaminase family protein [Pseudonocardiales bacterium]
MSLLAPVGRRLRVQHSTRYTYEPQVALSYNEARLTPRTEPRQQILETYTAISPMTWRHDFIDYWGTSVTSFEAHTPHGELSVISTTVADVAEAGDTPQVGWDRLRTERTVDAFAETLVATKRSEAPAELAALARDAIGELAPHDAARVVCGIVNDAMEYSRGSTGVTTVAAEAWEARRGVCQDLTHLAIGALRSVGIPARYVSGYAAPRGSADIGEAIVGESHAWVEWWTGGWYGWDPTSDGPAGSRHLAVGRGRDYGDVAPLKGIVAGSGRSSLDVSVIVTILR